MPHQAPIEGHRCTWRFPRAHSNRKKLGISLGKSPTSPSALGRRIASPYTGKNRDLLEERLTRLRANAIEIKQEQCHYIGGLIDEAFKDSKTKKWVIVLNPRLGALFADDQFTQIDWAVRHALNNHPLAQWLHGFYASHARPYDMYVRTLHKLCGSGAARMDHFRDTLRSALKAVAIASHAHGQPFDYEIRRDGLVKVKKTPTKAQRRHLAKKAARLTAKHA